MLAKPFSNQAVPVPVPTGKPVLQSILEIVTGRNLDPVEVAYSSYTVPVGPAKYGMRQSILVRKETNLRTGHTMTTEEKGGVA